ncbi:DUF2955 domain-containing protein [Pseudohaliea rubra]|uniref:Putative Membrane protein n=1 Tax=Pseudohaliea rubra DSM 19751 TaxID=1265313 RepID=A0A095XTQ4_9GAMM|nr:DUF2955 domain-containing protein [Pseudohaliea rubra]KGE03036.1 putative Membrane protein [Pseudohaliea rubra DSM 19751]
MNRKAARRSSHRLAAATALAIAAGYGLALPMPFLAALLAVFLTSGAGEAPGAKRIVAILLALALTLGLGVLLGPLASTYPVTGLTLMAIGIFISTRIAVSQGREPLGMLLAIGCAVIPAIAAVDPGLAALLIGAMVQATAIALLCQLAAFALFPATEAAPAPPPAPALADSQWIALRATVFMAPPVALLLLNPTFYLPVAMKSLLLSREASALSTRAASRELLTSTLAGGVGAVLFWLLLGLAPTLWFFTLWTALFTAFAGYRCYGLVPSRYGPTWWVNALVTLLILLGAAVQDSAAGKDVYQAFALRLVLFLGVSGYALLATAALERWRNRRRGARARTPEALPCL